MKKTGEDNNNNNEELIVRFFRWELRASRPGKNTITIVLILSVLILSLTALIKFA